MDRFRDGNGGAARVLRARASARGLPRDGPSTGAGEGHRAAGMSRARLSKPGTRSLPRRAAVAATLLVVAIGGAAAPGAASDSGPPVNTVAPGVAGTAVVGATLTASPGSWSGAEPMSYAYAWERCGPGYAQSVLAAGPVGYWRLGEGSGATAVDASGLGHDGAYAGGHALGEPGALAVDADRAVALSSVSPAGTVTVPHRPSLNSGNSVTYEAWVRLLSLPAASSVGANIATKSTGTLVLRILPSGVLSVRKSGGSELTRSTAPLVADGDFHHVVAAKAGSNLRVYIDGEDVTGIVVPQNLKNNATQLTIAGDFPAENRDGINGSLDEFALYARALSAAEVAQHYAAGREGVCAPVAGANEQSYVVGAQDAGSALRVKATASNADGAAGAYSAATELVRPATPPANTTAPSVTGSAQVGETLSASTGSWSGSEPIEYAYQWRRCDAGGGGCGDVVGATAAAYQLAEADVDATMRVAVTAGNATGSSTAVSEATDRVAPVSPPASAPVSTAAPTVAGATVVGETLTASTGSWSGTEPIAYAYQWERCEPGYAQMVLAAAPIGYWRLGETSGATAVDASGLGHDGGYAGGFALGEAGALAVDGNAAVRLTSVSPAGTVTVAHRSSLNYGDAVTYEAWVRLRSLPAPSSVGANIATKSVGSLVLRILTSGHLSVRKSGGSELARSTQPLVAGGGYQHVVAVKAGADVRVYIDGVDVTGPVTVQTLANNTTQLTIAGNNPAENRDGIDGSLDEFALYDRGLSAAEVAAHYAAGRDGVCAPVAGATGETYVVDADDVGSALQLEVTASNAAGSAKAISAPTDRVEAPTPPQSAPVSTAPPVVSGTATVGETLSASAGSWSGSEPIAYAYQWRTCDASGGDCTDIEGAGDVTYVLAAADAGATVRVAVTASNGAGSATAVSEQTEPVAEAEPDPPASGPSNSEPPAITGTPAVGETLTASRGTWSGTAPISYAYRWRRCTSEYAGLVSSAAPIGYWRLGEASGSTAADSSALGHDGAYSGSFALGHTGAPALDPNSAVRIGWTSPSGTVIVAHRSSLNVGDAITYEAWVRLLRLPAASTVGANIVTKSVGSLVFRILPSGVLSLRKSGGGELTQSTTPLAADGRYHHVVAAKAGADVRVYVDGLDVTGSVANQTLTNNTTQLTIAGNSATENRDGIDGYLDEFALYNRALSAAEVAAHHAAARDGTCQPIDGASGDSYVVAAADAGSALSVEVTASNAAGSATAVSAPTALVAATVSAPANTAPPSVTGVLQAGETVTASAGEWTGSEPISYEYQWRRCDADGGGCSDVGGATATTYTLAAADMGARIRVAVTASNSAGTATAASAATAQVAFGYAGPSSLGTGERPTASKPQSKLWWNDGSWWVSMWSSTSNSYSIFALNAANQTWVDSGTLIDSRPGTRADTLWDGTHLYVASHVLATCGCSTPEPGQPSRLYRYSYDGVANEYVLDEGFPVAINDVSSETLVIDKDSMGTLWATWAQENKIYVNRTTGDDRTWGSAFALPFQEAQSLTADDISSLVAFGGDRIGVMWSNQNANAMYFAVHRDGDAADVWQSPEIALTGTRYADDHLNLKAEASGRVLVAMKTARNEQFGTPATDPQMMLLDRAPATGGGSATWTAHVAGTVGDDHTRPIVLVDEGNRVIHLFATAPTTPGGTIYHKSSPLDAISFAPGRGTPFMRGAGGSNVSLNDPTATKQSVNATTGIVVVASERPGNRYWHNYMALE